MRSRSPLDQHLLLFGKVPGLGFIALLLLIKHRLELFSRQVPVVTLKSLHLLWHIVLELLNLILTCYFLLRLINELVDILFGEVFVAWCSEAI